LKVNEDYYEDKCSICLEKMQAKAKPEECRHIFCHDCIMAWTRFSNVCPLCKVEIYNLFIFDEQGLIKESLKIEKPKCTEPLDDTIYEMFDEFCYECRLGDNE
jgi:hypothetical protein